MLQICGDTQRSVDAFIRKNEPGLKERYSNHLRKQQTIYTILRNEIGHKGRAIKDVNSEVEQILPRFETLLRVAIEQIN